MPCDGEHFHQERCAISDRAAGHVGESVVKQLEVEMPSSADRDAHPVYVMHGILVSRAVYCFEHVVCKFAFRHGEPRIGTCSAADIKEGREQPARATARRILGALPTVNVS